MSPVLPIFRAALTLAIFAPLASMPAQAQLPVPRLVKDLNTGSNGSGSAPTDFRDIEGALVFSAYPNEVDDAHLWMSDGTEAGTQPLVNPDPTVVATWDPRTWVHAGGKWFFVAARANDPGLRLWAHNRSGVWLWDLAGFPAAPQNLTASGGLLYFTVNHGGPTGTVLWRSDGTSDGTFPLSVAAPGDTQPGNGFSSITRLTPALNGNGLWFAVDNTKLYRSGGTPETTVEVDYTAALPSGSIGQIAAAGDGIFFTCHANNDTILAKTDGSSAGTVNIGGGEDEGPWSFPGDLFHWKGAIYFTALTPEYERQLFRSDGTAAGTGIVKPFDQGPASDSPRIVGATDDFIFLVGDDVKNGIQLWRTDGTAKGTKKLTRNPRNTYIDKFKMIGGKLWFFGPAKGSGALWVSDGTPKGTRVVKAFNQMQYLSYVEEISSANGVCYLSASDGAHGLELWKSDGTAKGTVMVKDIVEGEAGGVWDGSDVAVVGNHYYFIGANKMLESQLWRSDGTAKGTTLVRDFGNAYSEWSSPGNLAAAGGYLTFSLRNFMSQEQVWSSSGTAAGTRKEKNIPFPPEPDRVVEVGGKAFAAFHDGLYLLRPGHRQGPLHLGGASSIPEGSGFRNSLAVMNGRIYFAGSGPWDYASLWTSDGTPEGTIKIKGSIGECYDVLALDGSLYFLSRHEGAVRLWKSDGTAAGTVQMAESPLAVCDWLTMEACAGKIFLFGKAAGAERRLYCWTGSGDPVLLKSFTGTNAAAKLHDLHAGGNLLYFSFDDAAVGAELWRSDGTADGTVVVKDIRPGTASSQPANLVSTGWWTYFTADNGTNGTELWCTDGSPGNAAMIADLHWGATGSEPEGLRVVGERLLFSAFTEKGRELWAIDKAGEVPPSPGGVIITVPAPVTPAAIAPEEDPQALLRHAFNVTQAGDTTPMISGSGTSGYPAISTSGQVLRVEYLRRKDSSLIYTPQYSASLAPGTFLPMTGSSTVTDIDALWERVVAEQPYDPAITPQLFARVEVKATP